MHLRRNVIDVVGRYVFTLLGREELGKMPIGVCMLIA